MENLVSQKQETRVTHTASLSPAFPGALMELVAVESLTIGRRGWRRVVGDCGTVSLCQVNTLECCFVFEERVEEEEEDTEKLC